MIRAGINIIDLLDKPYREFALGMNGLNFQAVLSGAEFKRYHTDLKRKLDGEPVNQESTRVRELSTHMYLVDLSAGPELVDPMGSIPQRNFGEWNEAADEKLAQWMEDGFNEQLRWILVSSFELHEKLVRGLYAAVGYIESDKWKVADFGRNYAGDARTEPFEWFEERAGDATKRGCKEVISQLRRAFPDIEKYAGTTWLAAGYTDHSFWRSVIEYFRHLIVHVRGTTKTEQFWKRISKETGCTFLGSGEGDQQRKRAVQQFVRLSNGEVRIELINRAATANPTHHGVDKKFRDLQKILVNYTSMLYAVVIRHYDHEPVWDRDWRQ